MKKTLYMFLTALFAVTIFAGCSDDDNDITFNDTAANDAAGVYEGTYYRTMNGVSNAQTEEAPGTMTVTAADKYTANFTFTCADWDVNQSCIGNVSHSNNGFAFSNHVKTNALGSAFLGRVDNDKNVETHLSLSIFTVRGAKTFTIVFKGKKVTDNNK